MKRIKSGSLGIGRKQAGDVFQHLLLHNAPVVAADGIGTAFGDSATGIVDGPGQFNVDLSLMRTVPIRWPKEGSSLQFRAEFFSALNHPQFLNPNTTFGSSSFGQQHIRKSQSAGKRAQPNRARAA
jgi:hypothetical protein